MSKIKQPMLTGSSFEDSSTEWDSDEDDFPSLLEDFALYEDPPLTFLQAFLPSLDLMIFLLMKRGTSLVKMGMVFLVLGIVSNCFLPNHAVLRSIWLGALVIPTLLMAMAVLFMAHVVVSKRQPAFESAKNQLWERIQDGRAIRKDGYDIYLPPTSSSSMEEKKESDTETSTTNKHGIILFPGALINPSAYASLAAKLSDHGILVVIMSYGPSLMTMDVADCQDRAQMAMYNVAYELDYLGLDMPSINEWVLAGHSLGGTLALNAAANMEDISKVILCGVGRDAMGVTYTLRSSDKQVLVVNGSNDPFVTECTDAQKTDFQHRLPQPCDGENNKGKTTFVTIEGGNHAGFAHYGPQTYPKLDGERTLSIDEQQEQFVQNTLELLNMGNKFQKLTYTHN